MLGNNIANILAINLKRFLTSCWIIKNVNMEGMSMYNNLDNLIPQDFIVFISGVPGVGKTTVSYELLKRYEQFRIIEETDLIREILRGYNDYLTSSFGDEMNSIINEIEISDHNKLLSLEDAKVQCQIMKSSFEQIVKRQQRKGINTIINGVHIIPELLFDISKYTVFINLYVTDERIIKERIKNRNPDSYMLDYIPFIYKTNNELYNSTKEIALKTNNVFNLNVTDLDINQTLAGIQKCINRFL